MHKGMRDTALLLSLGAAIIAGCGSGANDDSGSTASVAASTPTTATTTTAAHSPRC